jgi:two-component system response regulator GlrR
MHLMHSATLLLMELAPESEQLCVLRSILEQADIEVLVSEQPPSSGRDSEWVARACLEGHPSLAILLAGQKTLSDGALFGGVLASLPPDIPVIVAAQDFEATEIRNVLESGVNDFITPPFSPASVLPRVWRLLRQSASCAGDRETLPEKLALKRLGLVSESPSFLKEIKKLRRVARCDITVMIWGETGTGKELVARAIHYLSPRSDRPFVPIDCAAVPPELTESELFGHERGAFTGAVTRSRGLIAAADQGTLFLDEVDALSLSVQAKLLRFIQEREYRPLGSSEIRKADVRIISASNCDLQQLVRDNAFREDLYYRLNVVQLRLPGLRQRREDVILLATHFADKYAARFNQPGREFSRGALQKLLMHQWPGNIRELENVVEAAVALCDGPVIRASDIALASEQPQVQASFREAKARIITEFERDYVMRLLRACAGNVSEAARAAGKNRRAFWELMRKHEISTGDLRDSSAGSAERKPTVRAAGLVTRQP